MDGKLTTDSQIKPTDKHQYLHFSSHSDHTKVNKNSQTFWLSKIYTFENDYIRHKYETKSWFLQRGKFELAEVLFPTRPNEKFWKVTVISFAVKKLNNIIDKAMYLLYMNQQVKAVFSSRSMISFLGSRKLSSYLVRVKLYPLERVVGSCRCNANKCQVCSNITESDELSDWLIIRPTR